jgi:hypothetical protein
MRTERNKYRRTLKESTSGPFLFVVTYLVLFGVIAAFVALFIL